MRAVTQAALLALLIVAVAAPARAATCAGSPFLVTSIGDGGDAAPNDGTCADAVGACTLRAAIEEMNAGACSATINFNISGCGGVCTLAPATPLPAVTQPVTIDGYTQPGASANTLANGSDAVLLIEIDGTSVAAGNSGLSITGGSSTVRGLVINRFVAAAGNPPVNGYGINITGGGGNTITGNFVGIDPTGAVVRPNERGIGVLSGNNIVGGPTPDARNVVSGNGTGIQVNGAAAVSNVVQNNYIGVGPDGTTVLGNPGPNNAGFAGINVGGGATYNTIGGTTAAAANVIAGNSPNNIRIRGSATQHNVIEGNYIGTNAAGTSLGGGGVIVENSASNNQIGGQAAGAGNTIAYNATAGVTLVSGIGNAILSNSIHGNTFGLDIGNNGVGPANDACDPDGGPNMTQNFPTITSVTSAGGNTTIAGTLDSAASTTFTLEFFDNTSCDASGYGQGGTLIGSTTVSTGGSCGAVSFSGTFAHALAVGHVVTATATDPAGNTSEFSACAGVCGDGTVSPGEQCDDGNVVDGDCCSASCQAEVANCNDGNLCTQTDTCQGGVCTGTPVVCTALDQCHDAGTCDTGTGVCSNPLKAPGAPCGSSSSGECDNADSCDGEGTCLSNHVADATACNDGNACTEQDACAAGTCTGTPQPQGTPCTDDGMSCTEDVCDGTGICQHNPVTNSSAGTYTLDADFDQGTLFNVNHTTPNNHQLQLSWPTAPFPFINVAASDRGTVVRIDVNSGQILGEYQTAPDSMGRNPSRTTVDQYGNVWVANRYEYSFLGGQEKGSATRVGLLVGGTRTDASGTPDANGQYVKPPFQYNTCVDRDADGLLKTSRGLGNILPWTNAGSVDTGGGVTTAEDECIINYTRVTGAYTRTIAVDAHNDVWVGGMDMDHEKISGITGLPIPGTQFNLGCGGYGGLIDHNGVLWSAREQNGLLRFDTTTLTGACLGTAMGDYGLGIDPQTGDVWQTSYYQAKVCDITPAGTLIGCYAAPTSRGVAVDGSDNVWVVISDVIPTVRHLRTDGTIVGDVALPGAIFSTGVAVDTNGKVWVTNTGSNNVMRIDPSAGPLGGGGFAIGAVDMTVDLGVNSGPYNYSDMTGFVAIGTTSVQGTWTVTRDSGVPANAWGAVTWNTEPQGAEPAGTSITVEVRAADTVTGLASQLFTTLTNGGASGVTGRFVEIRATLVGTATESPVLSDLEIEVGCGPTTCSTDADCNDADECTTDTCSPGTLGASSFGCVYTGVVCTAPDACHDAACNPVTGQCFDSAKPEGASCPDQDLCNGDEVCQGGTCTAGSALDCDDGNLCSVDACDSVSGCTHVPGNAGAVCRPAAGGCDVPETCTGDSTACPDDNNPPCCNAKVFVVTSTADSSDASIGDTVCADAGGDCTLRAAIEEANVDECADTIHFNIPGCDGVCTLTPATPLPAVTQPVTIDGYTQPGASPNTLASGSDAVLLIEIDGTGVAPGNSGLQITGGSSTVRGLVINRFASLAGSPPVNGFGIGVTGAGGNTITGNFLGTDPTGTLARPNERGIGVSSANNTIGGLTPDARNVVSGNGTGIHINTLAAVSNVVQNNYVGVGPDGNTALGNTGFAGVNIGGGATNNTVGGTTAAAANVIAASSQNNVRIRGSATQNNVIEGNYIGTNAAGTSLGGGGVLVESSASNNRIGGQAAGAGNTIAYSSTAAVVLLSGTGNAILSNSIFGNALGIDIGNNGAGTANDACDPDSGPNLTQNFPVITGVSSSGGNLTIAGTLDSQASTTFTLEFFDNDSCDASGYGQGGILIGSATVITDGSCGVTFIETFPYALAAGHVVTATATDPIGNTSEFSACAGVCGDGAVGPGEQCDDGNVVNGDCCSSTCGNEAAGSSCGDQDGTACNAPDACNGSGSCVDRKKDSGTLCLAGTGTCDPDDTCDGTSNACIAVYAGSDVSCGEPDGTECNAPDTCDGSGSCVDRKKDSGTVCLAGTGTCDPDDTCDGTTNACAPVYASGGTGCDLDANVCTTDHCNGSGTCAFASNLDCDDGDLCTQDACDPSGGCENAATPAVGCNATAGKALLKIARDEANDSKDRVQFKWTKGTADMSEFGDPTTTTGYTLCVYDADGSVVGLSVAGGADCGDRPCWTLSGPTGAETGIKYKDSTKPAANDGVVVIKGKSDTTGKARLQVKAQGTNVPAIDLGAGLTYPVTAQVMTSDAACFEAAFDAGDEKTNDDTQFKAVRSVP